MSEDLRIEDRGGVRVLFLSRGKANALTAPFCAEIHRAAREAEADPAVRGIVLTSTSPTIFCGGFDLGLLAHADPGSFRDFLGSFDALFFDLFLLGKPLVAALTGHALVGGALVAATADFRLAAEGSGTLGLPEVLLGVHVPRHCLEAIRVTLGERALRHLALPGEAMSFAEARDLGAIDRIVPASSLLEEADALAGRLGTASSDVYAAIKRDLRGAAFERAREVQPEGEKAFVASWYSEAGQAGIARAVPRIRKARGLPGD